MRRIAILALLAVAGCGESTPSSVVPADASVYVGVHASEAERLLAATSREVDFARDVEPWLGKRAAYFGTAPDEYGLVFDAEDEDAAEAFGRKVAAGGPLRASAIVDGRLVVASSRELLGAANAAAGGHSLADSTRLDVADEDEDGAPDILIAAGEPSAFIAALDRYGVLPGADAVEPLLEGGPLTARVWIERDHARIDVAGLPSVASPPSLADLPGNAWLAFSAADIGAAIAPFAETRDEWRAVEHWTGLDLDHDVLPHLGAGTLYVQTTTHCETVARLFAEMDDEPALRRAAITAGRRLRRAGERVDLRFAGGDDPFVDLTVTRRGRDPTGTGLGTGFYLELQHGRASLDVGTECGSVAGLGETRLYRDAERRLGGPPTLLIDGQGSFAARRDGGTLRIVSAPR